MPKIDYTGMECWELDALEPRTMVDLIQTEITRHVDVEAYHTVIAEERKGQEQLDKLTNNWDEVAEFLETLS